MLRLSRMFLIFCMTCMPWYAGAEVNVPALSAYVIDRTGTLSPEQINTLNQALRGFETRKGSQIAVLLIPSTQPETIEQFGIRVADKWKLGRKKVDDGVILIVAKNDRTVRIEVGYGLEGALTDALSKRIIEETILPAFRQQNFYAGIAGAVTQIQKVIEGESLPPPSQSSGMEEGILSSLPVLFVIALVLGSILRRVLGRLIGAGVTGTVVAIVAWLIVDSLVVSILSGLFAFMFTLAGVVLGRGASSGYNGRGPGGGFGGGGGISGGGGGFGGGGSSGRW